MLRSLPIRRIADERLSRYLASVSVASAHNRDVVDSIDGDAPVIGDRIGQRPDLFAFVIYVVHLFIPPV